MTDLWLPDVRVASASPRLMDNTGRFSSPLSGTVRTVARPGDRWGVRLDYANLQGFDRARLESFIARMRGAANRLLWSPTIDFPLRGSFPAGELFANNNFANGVTGWNASAGCTISAKDRRLRAAFNGSGAFFVIQSPTNLTAYMPYVGRYFLVDGKGTPLALGILQSYVEGTISSVENNAVSVEGLNVLALVVDGTSSTDFLFYTGATPIQPGQIAGNYVDAIWTSFSQCALVDNGGNLLLQSDAFTTGWSANAASAAANASMAADGTTTAADISDTTANSGHYFNQGISVSSTPADYMICGEFKAQAQPYVWLQMYESTGGTASDAWFNLSTGALGTTTNGANWTNLRSFIVPLGNGWYYCCLVARKTNAATSLTAYFGSSNANGTGTYTGTGGVAIHARRVTCTQSSVPARQTMSANAVVAPTAQSGSALYIKGLPASSSGLLLAGDWCEINKELKRLTGHLDSDAAGRGYLQFSPPIRTSPNDNDPVIVNTPMGRFILSNNQTGWQSVPGPNAQPFATSSLDLIEAP